jgi:hypothetical protein
MKLPAVVDSLDAAPDAVRAAYARGADGRYHLTVAHDGRDLTVSAVASALDDARCWRAAREAVDAAGVPPDRRQVATRLLLESLRVRGDTPVVVDAAGEASIYSPAQFVTTTLRPQHEWLFTDAPVGAAGTAAGGATGHGTALRTIDPHDAAQLAAHMDAIAAGTVRVALPAPVPQPGPRVADARFLADLDAIASGAKTHTG